MLISGLDFGLFALPDQACHRHRLILIVTSFLDLEVVGVAPPTDTPTFM
jgi:hypothetical protein